MVDVEVLFTTAVLGVLFSLTFAAMSFKVVREAERLVVFRLGRLLPAKGPGLVQIVPIVDRAVPVDVPVHLIRLREEAPHALAGSRTPADEEVQGHPGITVQEVATRAAMMAVQRDPRTKKATTEDFLAASETVEGKDRSW